MRNLRYALVIGHVFAGSGAAVIALMSGMEGLYPASAWFTGCALLAAATAFLLAFTPSA